jgi:hypothetical protein
VLAIGGSFVAVGQAAFRLLFDCADVRDAARTAKRAGSSDAETPLVRAV